MLRFDKLETCHNTRSQSKFNPYTDHKASSPPKGGESEAPCAAAVVAAGSGPAAARLLGNHDEAATAQEEERRLELVLAEVWSYNDAAAFEVSAMTQEYFRNLLDFLAAKNELDTIAERVLPNHWMEQFPSFVRANAALTQRPLDGSDPSRMTVEQVAAAAAAAVPSFRMLVFRIAEDAGIAPAEGMTVRFAPLKSLGRSREKVIDDYQGDASRLVDVVRASVTVESEAGLTAVTQAVMAHCGAAVVRLKNRFCEPLFNGAHLVHERERERVRVRERRVRVTSSAVKVRICALCMKERERECV